MDGSLKSLGGHPHDIDLRLAKTMVESGHDVHVYCHVDADDVLKSQYHEVAPITPIFTINPYIRSDNFDFAAGDIIKNLVGGRTTASELTTAREADAWLWPSLYPHQLIACCNIKTNALISGCIHHTPEFFSSGDTAWWRYGLIQAQKNRLNLKVGSIEPELLYLYSPLTTNGRFSLFPYPNDGAESIVEHKAMKTIGVFGAQREEKGGALLRQLLEMLVADGYEVILHDSSQGNAGYGDISGVIRLGHVMDLDAEIAKCDLVLAPYHPDFYKQRGSGIVMSALASGVPVVVPYGSAPGRLIEQTGAGALFHRFSPDFIYASVKLANNNYAAIAKAAYRVGSQWKNHHGIKRFMNAMIQAHEK